VVVLVIYLVLLLLMAGMTTGIGLAISQQITGVVRDLRGLSRQIPEQLEALSQARLQLGPWQFDLSQVNLEPLVERLSSALQPLLVGTGSFLASLAATTASILTMVALILIFGFYLLVDFEKLEPAFLGLVPEPYVGDFERLLEQTGKVWQAFLRGQFILGLVIGSAVAIVLSVIGLRFALGLGLIAGLLEFVPIFGPVISGMIAILVALFQEGNWLGLSPLGLALVVAGIFVVIQQLENNILQPRIIGHSLNLNPFIVLLAVLSGGILAGVLGVLLAAPMVATMRIWLGYMYRKSVGLETRPTPVIGPPSAPEGSLRIERVRKWWQLWREKRRQSQVDRKG
jgi:predicted PurR-regulated permease PerM